MGVSFFNQKIETMDRGDLDALVEDRIRYTVMYAAEKSPFYRKWFREHGIKPSEIRTHEDLKELPIISGKTIRENQPPHTSEFKFMSTGWEDIYTVHETSGTSGTPKTFFLI
jgi:phenylacetate-coenzyme A ligase PaaK-like adenylate-forming protein